MSDTVSSFGVIGSGIMGRGIAEVAATRGGFEKVIMLDAEQSQLDSALQSIEKNLSYLVEKGKMEEAARSAALERLSTATDIKELASCGFVVEAVPENIDIKGRVFAQLVEVLDENAVIASNTSSIPITRLASFVKKPQNFIGMHFMNPVPRMKGLEIIRGIHTSQPTGDITLELAGRFGKEVTFSKDKAGFVINRILIPMLNDAARALDAGLSRVQALDTYCTRDKEGPRHRMGPLMLSDLIGLDTIVHILRVLEAELSPTFAPGALLTRMVDKGLLGQKSGRGFYLWDKGRPGDVNSEVAELADAQPPEDEREGAALAGMRAWLVMVNEAVKVVEEGTSSIDDVDRGCLFCLAHPQGVLAALDAFGIGKACKELTMMEERFGPDYKPAPLLRRLTEAGLIGGETGRGIYTWDAGEPAGINPVLNEYLL